jgi:signal transduction histidine kinase
MSSDNTSGELTAIAAYLAQRQPDVLRRWHALVDGDPELSSASSISRAQFYDHIPQVLEAFERRLAARNPGARQEAQAEEKRSAAEHGLHRWQQGYNQHQTMREWAHLQMCLLEEIEDYASAHPRADGVALREARRALARLCGDGVCESAAHYARLQQLEAAGRLRDLQQAFSQLQTLERERAERLREAAHDLRSSVGVVRMAAEVLDRSSVSESARAQMAQALQRGTVSLRDLLTDLMDLARLEAGHERRNLVEFDAAQTLREFCEPLRALAAQRNLFLRTDGPEQLLVEGDPPKVQRIAQNLVLNALKATSEGGVRVTWEAHTHSEREQWILCIQDTGPGLTTSSGAAPLARALKHATEESQEVEASVPAEPASERLDPAPTLPSRSAAEAARPPGGEGIGLSIVKRLCELLDASIELETAPGDGTTFRVIFPRRYPGQP